MFVSEDQSEAFVAYFRVLAEANAPISSIRLKGLNHRKQYYLVGKGEVYGGDELMYVGINIPYILGDFMSFTWVLKEWEKDF